MKALPHHNKQKGAVLVLVTVALFVLLGFTALALDGGYLLLNKNRLQDAVDAAALSGAKTLSSDDVTISTQDNARAAALDTLRLALSKDGFQFINVDIDELASTVNVEFSHQPVPFELTPDDDAKYIRVRMESVPVTQFLSQIMVDVWQVRVSGVAGPLAQETYDETVCDVIPLLMCSKGDSGSFGYKAADLSSDNPEDHNGDVILIKSPAPGSSELGPGNFKAVRLGDSSGADDYRESLAGGHCIDTESIVDIELDTTETGNMAGPSRQGLNTRFGIYNPGKFQEPKVEPPGGNGDYYSDRVLSNVKVVSFSGNDFDDLEDGDSVILDKTIADKMQRYKDYRTDSAKNKYALDRFIDYRRVVKVPVADCPTSGGVTSLEAKGTACMFLNQEVTGNGNTQYIVAEFLSECPSGGTGGSGNGVKNYRLVLFNDTDSGDS